MSRIPWGMWPIWTSVSPSVKTGFGVMRLVTFLGSGEWLVGV